MLFLRFFCQVFFFFFSRAGINDDEGGVRLRTEYLMGKMTEFRRRSSASFSGVKSRKVTSREPRLSSSLSLMSRSVLALFALDFFDFFVFSFLTTRYPRVHLRAETLAAAPENLPPFMSTHDARVSPRLYVSSDVNSVARGSLNSVPHATRHMSIAFQTSFAFSFVLFFF